ncbi:type II toxin-antitoxin system VapC family toxin [Nocardia mangyaensis]|uniref:type II toxin-antitoxin system VapC family toxin n=1 Tax=Nocardia mangyaensis TaxID=2213200 RepID=UPI002676CC89|nr:type II toxin-antitoxin system VapC family toxin [Nocardia mangyaensis]MDO3647191.1 type II toxin-antitoxin system VapC family toxin [Nocardia mangyaensis]
MATSGRALRLAPEQQPVTLVDSCVLLDVLTDDPKWADWSDDALAEARDAGLTVINPIIYAEVAGGFDTIEALDDALPESELERVPLPFQAGFVASKAFVAYRRRGREKRSPLPDFYIGAHAAVADYRLLTRDSTRFRTYFPRLQLITPDDE